MKKPEESKNTGHMLRKISRVFTLLLAGLYIYGLYILQHSNIVPAKYMAAAVATGGIVVAVSVFVSFFRKKSPRYFGLVVHALLLIVATFGLYTAGSASQSVLTLLDHALDPQDYTTLTYSVIALKDSHVQKQKNTDAQIGIIGVDSNKQALTTALSKDFKPAITEYADLANVTVALEDGKTQAAALLSSSLVLLKENYSAFYDKTEVVDTLEIKIPRTVSSQKTDTKKPFIVYISGIDTYGEIATVSRSDVNMLAVVNPVNHTVLLVNTPRDYYVQLHGTTGLRDKLTHAGIYGIDMSKRTLEDLYGIHIDYYVRINFSSLEKVIDALGGVNVYSDQAFSSYTYSYAKGYNFLNSKQALEFARERYHFADGDRARGRNQQRVIEAIIAKIASPHTIVNYKTILNALDGAFQTNAPSDDITDIIKRQLDGLYVWKVESIQVDGTGTYAPTYSVGGTPLSVLEPIQSTVDAAKAKIADYMR